VSTKTRGGAENSKLFSPLTRKRRDADVIERESQGIAQRHVGRVKHLPPYRIERKSVPNRGRPIQPFRDPASPASPARFLTATYGRVAILMTCFVAIPRNGFATTTAIGNCNRGAAKFVPGSNAVEIPPRNKKCTTSLAILTSVHPISPKPTEAVPGTKVLQPASMITNGRDAPRMTKNAPLPRSILATVPHGMLWSLIPHRATTPQFHREAATLATTLGVNRAH